MPQSLSSIYLHTIFSTKGRLPYLRDNDQRRWLHAYIGTTSHSLGCEPLAVGGMPDHVHLLARFGRSVSVAHWVGETKRVSAVHMKKASPDFAWQSGYGVFAVESINLDRIIRYIESQEEHHRVFDFQEEFRKIMAEHRIEWDERYVWQ